MRKNGNYLYDCHEKHWQRLLSVELRARCRQIGLVQLGEVEVHAEAGKASLEHCVVLQGQLTQVKGLHAVTAQAGAAVFGHVVVVVAEVVGGESGSGRPGGRGLDDLHICCLYWLQLSAAARIAVSRDRESKTSMGENLSLDIFLLLLLLSLSACTFVSLSLSWIKSARCSLSLSLSLNAGFLPEI